MNPSDLKRFEAKYVVDFDTNCWLWVANSWVYGIFWYKGRPVGAHRFAYMAYKGKIPQGKSVLHSCDTPLCVNPSHLFLGTQKENIDDMFQKKRANKARGIRNGHAKLTEKKVRAIRNAEGLQREIAEDFDVDQSLVSLIKGRKIWIHVT